MFIRSIAVLFLMCSIEMPIQAFQDFRDFRILKSDVPQSSGMAHTVRRTFLEEHNGRRALLAKGDAKIKGGEELPYAANMRFMAYDCELEKEADEITTRACERIPESPEFQFNETKTNFAIIDSRISNGDVSASREAVSQWWNQSSHWQDPKKITIEDKSAIPFFLMAQAEGDKVGCSVRPCKKGGFGPSYYSVACVYEKKVEVGTKLYEEGQACTKCPDGYDTHYKDALCKKPKQQKP